MAGQGVAEKDLDAYIEKADSLANLQLLTKEENTQKSGSDFDAWFNKVCPTENDKVAYRKLHFIPDMEYTYANFLDFIAERENLIKERIKIIAHKWFKWSGV